jgi:hypothetical protein
MVQLNTYRKFKLGAAELELSPPEIMEVMRYNKESAPDHFSEITSQLLRTIDGHSHIQTGFILLEIDSIDHSNHVVKIHNHIFNTGKIVTDQLRGSRYLAIFTATMGKPFDDWSQSCFRNGDPVTGFIIDTIGSEAVERVADFLESKLLEELAPESLRITNRFSPGYCDWHVSEQQNLFSLLPQNFCGIDLTPSSLMIPIKSVSGIIGIGTDVERDEYPCRFCSREECHKHRLQKKGNPHAT